MWGCLSKRSSQTQEVRQAGFRPGQSASILGVRKPYEGKLTSTETLKLTINCYPYFCCGKLHNSCQNKCHQLPQGTPWFDCSVCGWVWGRQAKKAITQNSILTPSSGRWLSLEEAQSLSIKGSCLKPLFKIFAGSTDLFSGIREKGRKIENPRLCVNCKKW